MKLSLKNIGRIETANIVIDGITVIAGENNAGKSTVGKALFAVFNSFYNTDKKIFFERINSIEHQIEMIYRSSVSFSGYSFDVFELAKDIVMLDKLENKEDYVNSIREKISQYDEKILDTVAPEVLNESFERIISLLRISDDKILESVIQKKIDVEFNEQIGNLYSDLESKILLEIRGELTEVEICEHRVVNVSKQFNLGTEAIYIDDPFVLDEVPYRFWRTGIRNHDHRTHLKEKLSVSRGSRNVVDEIFINSKFESIYNKVSEVCEGSIIRGKQSFLGYKVSGSDKVLDIRNLSTGLKTFAILKRLLVNGQIEPNGTIILDEPEIHLHPEWQLIFAELIVLLQKVFGIHILLNTHSPYFLNAIEVYSAKHEVADKCKYYIATNNEQNIACIDDVTEDIDIIYKKLAKPLQDLENVRYSND